MLPGAEAVSETRGAHPESHGHWDCWQISDLLYQRDDARAERDEAMLRLANQDDECVLLLKERDALREALRWYADEAEAIARHVLAQKTTAVMASMQVLALDAGRRARAILGEKAK